MVKKGGCGWRLEAAGRAWIGARKHRWVVRPNSQGSYISYPLMCNKSLQSLAALNDKHLLFQFQWVRNWCEVALGASGSGSLRL